MGSLAIILAVAQTFNSKPQTMYILLNHYKYCKNKKVILGKGFIKLVNSLITIFNSSKEHFLPFLCVVYFRAAMDLPRSNPHSPSTFTIQHRQVLPAVSNISQPTREPHFPLAPQSGVRSFQPLHPMPLIDFSNPLDRLTQFNICLFLDLINGLSLEQTFISCGYIHFITCPLSPLISNVPALQAGSRTTPHLNKYCCNFCLTTA